MSFFDASAKERVTNAVRAAESDTSAQIVVCVRPSCADYRVVDVGFGILLATALLCLFLYYPAPFGFTFLPLELSAVFVIGMLLSLGVPPLKRRFVTRRATERALRRAACEAFVDARVHTNRRRTGVLVLVSAFEQKVEIVRDIGVTAPLDASALERAVRRHDVEGFARALVSLGSELAKVLPRAADDTNELPDAPSELA